MENIKYYDRFRPKTAEGKNKKNTDESVYALYKGWGLIFNAFRSRIFQIKETQSKGRPPDIAARLKILSPKQIRQILPIALAQVKAANTSKNLLTEIKQIILWIKLLKIYI